MFKLQPNPTFPATVTGFVPGDPTAGVTMQFKHQTREQYDKWVGSFAGEPLISRLPEIVADWEDAPVPYTPEALAEVANTYPALPVLLLQTYTHHLFTAQQKN